MLENLKKEIWRMNLELPKNGLVVMTGGNVSGRDFKTNLVVIKPSGMLYEEMQPEDMVLVNLDGKLIEGKLAPSTDTESHLYIYKNMSHVGAVVHTHSDYATSFSAIGKSIPCCLTAIADEFGGDIPIAPYARIGTDQIGKAVVEHIGNSPAILLKQHGVFTVGRTVFEAVKAAVMVEDVAKTVHLAIIKGKVKRLPEEEIKAAYERYSKRYGQKK